uniref:Uncharacterized protein n=1 Tax=Anopheles minimus TaxID=112268 RepID=A0A182WAP7_9DIPT
MRTNPALGGTRNARSDQLNALLATLMHYIRENATTETAIHCLRYMPKDPRLRSTGRLDPRGIPSTRSSSSSTTTNITASSTSNSSSSGKSTSTTTTVANVRFRRAGCASGKKNIRSNIRPIVDDATSAKKRLILSTSIGKLRNDVQGGSDTLTCLSGQLLNGV